MNKQVKLKAKETAATNSDFYNLFRPIAPSINVIGKVAQIISGLTEAITIWYITQSEMAGSSKILSLAVSIVAMVLVVALLELGGRKFLQVLTRALVWNRLRNAWYVALFGIVLLITVGMGVLSFRLSTNGINHAFVSNVPVGSTFDASALRTEYRNSVRDISTRFDSDLQVIKENHREVIASTNAQFDSRINAAKLKAGEYDAKYAQGFKWAKSQEAKYRRKATLLETEKANTIVGFQSAYSQKIDRWQSAKGKAIDQEKLSRDKVIAKAENSLHEVRDSQHQNAAFWGNLFSFFVGFSVILAFICIISTEVYRRGAGIEVKYQEEEKDPSIFSIFRKGLSGRMDSFFRSRAERFAQVKTIGVESPKIGFDFPVALPMNQVEE